MKYSVTSPRNSFTTTYAGRRVDTRQAVLVVAADLEPTKRGLIRMMRKETEGRPSINRPQIRQTITKLSANTTARNRMIRQGKDSRRTTISIRAVSVIPMNGKSSLRTKRRHLTIESRSRDSNPPKVASSPRLVKRPVNLTRVKTSTVLSSEVASMALL